MAPGMLLEATGLDHGRGSTSFELPHLGHEQELFLADQLCPLMTDSLPHLCLIEQMVGKLFHELLGVLEVEMLESRGSMIDAIHTAGQLRGFLPCLLEPHGIESALAQWAVPRIPTRWDVGTWKANDNGSYMSKAPNTYSPSGNTTGYTLVHWYSP